MNFKELHAQYYSDTVRSGDPTSQSVSTLSKNLIPGT